MTDRLLTASDVAHRTGRPLRTVQRAAETGALSHSVKAPGPRGAYLFTLADVDAWLDPQDAA